MEELIYYPNPDKISHFSLSHLPDTLHNIYAGGKTECVRNKF